MVALRQFPLIALGLLLALATIEAAVRIDRSLRPERYTGLPVIGPSLTPAETRWVDHPFLPFVGRPNSEIADHHPEYGGVRTLTTNNAHGFRSRPFADVREPGGRTVLTFGGSTTWGAIAETNATTWPGLLEDALRRHYPADDVRVFNFGTSTATSAFTAVTLATLGLHLNPDLVIVYHAKTDYEPLRRDDYRSDHAHYFRDLDLEKMWPGWVPSLPAAFGNSLAVTVAAAALDAEAQLGDLMTHVTRPGPANVDPAHGVSRLIAHLDTVHSIATGNGARALFSTFQFRDGETAALAAVNQALRDHFTAKRRHFVDQDSLIPDDSPDLHIDDCHLTRRGREWIATNFYDYIVRHDLLDRDRD